MRGAGFHASGSGNHLWADLDDDGEISGFFQQGIPIADHGYGLWAVAPGFLHAAMVKGVRPLAAMPTTTSSLSGFRSAISFAQRRRVFTGFGGGPERPDATGDHELHVSGSVLKVGGHSEASSAAIRPLVPAPT